MMKNLEKELQGPEEPGGKERSRERGAASQRRGGAPCLADAPGPLRRPARAAAPAPPGPGPASLTPAPLRPTPLCANRAAPSPPWPAAAAGAARASPSASPAWRRAGRCSCRRRLPDRHVPPFTPSLPPRASCRRYDGRCAASTSRRAREAWLPALGSLALQCQPAPGARRVVGGALPAEVHGEARRLGGGGQPRGGQPRGGQPRGGGGPARRGARRRARRRRASGSRRQVAPPARLPAAPPPRASRVVTDPLGEWAWGRARAACRVRRGRVGAV